MTYIRRLSYFAQSMNAVVDWKRPAWNVLGMMVVPASGDGFYVKRDELRLYLKSCFDKLLL